VRHGNGRSVVRGSLTATSVRKPDDSVATEAAGPVALEKPVLEHDTGQAPGVISCEQRGDQLGMAHRWPEASPQKGPQQLSHTSRPCSRRGGGWAPAFGPRTPCASLGGYPARQVPSATVVSEADVTLATRPPNGGPWVVRPGRPYFSRGNSPFCGSTPRSLPGARGGSGRAGGMRAMVSAVIHKRHWWQTPTALLSVRVERDGVGQGGLHS